MGVMALRSTLRREWSRLRAEWSPLAQRPNTKWLGMGAALAGIILLGFLLRDPAPSETPSSPNAEPEELTQLAFPDVIGKTADNGQDGIRRVFPNAEFVVRESPSSRLGRIQDKCDAAKWPSPAGHWLISRTSPAPFAPVYAHPDTSLRTTLWVDAPADAPCETLPARPPA